MLAVRKYSEVLTGERSGVQTRISTTGKRFVGRANEKLTAFLELERVTRETLASKMPNDSAQFSPESDEANTERLRAAVFARKDKTRSTFRYYPWPA